MTDLDRASLDRILPSSAASPDWEDVMARAAAFQRGRRRRVVLLTAAGLVLAVVAASAIGGLRDVVVDKGFIGLPPEGATPSAPESGDLVVSWAGLSASLPRNHVRAWLYADGRIIWERRPWHEDPKAARPPEGANELVSGYLEQRLTQEGVDLVRSEVDGLFDRTRAVLETFPADDDPWPPPKVRLTLFVPGEYGPTFGSVETREGEQRLRLHWGALDEKQYGDIEGPTATPEQLSALRRVDALLTDPASVLPSHAWAARKVRAYVPSHYAVCIHAAPAADASGLLSVLPPRAAELLRDNSRERAEGDVVSNIDQEPGHMVVIGRSVTDCYKVETEEAREVAKALSGLERKQGWGRYGLAYDVVAAVNNLGPTWLRFEPYFPDGQFPFSGPSG